MRTNPVFLELKIRLLISELSNGRLSPIRLVRIPVFWTNSVPGGEGTEGILVNLGWVRLITVMA
ncbi:hypothetical protein D3C76_1430570 [compost metagenome]